MKSLKRLFTPPAFDDGNKTQQAYMLHIILWTLIFVPIPYVIYALVLNPEGLSRALVQAAFGEAANILALAILRRGYVKAASVMQVGAFWFFFTASALTGNGVQGEAYLIGYTLAITVAGILLGGTGALIVTFLSLGTGLFMIYLPQAAAESGRLSQLTTWVVSFVLFPVIALLQHLASRRAQTALIRATISEEKYRLISNVTSDYLFSTRLDKEGNVRLDWVAGAFESMTGYTFEEYLANGGWLAHLHPDDLEIDNRALVTLKANQQTIHELRTYKKSGEIQWVRVYAHPIWDEEHNRLTAIVGAVQDITDRKKMEQERETLIHELENKNAELERFTYTVSHDLKSPLVTITGFLGFLEKDALSGDWNRAKGSIDRISRAAGKMQTLLNDLLELSRVGRVINQPQDVRFEEIVYEAIDHVRGRLDEVDAIVEIQRGLPIVHGDRVRLVEVVQNLVENAVKYAKPEGKLRIEIGADGKDENGRLLFHVRDNGVGIEPQYHERIFGLFNKLDNQSEGTGIGLSLVKRIIEVHGGRIWVESEKGKGAAFHFTLPTPTAKEPACADDLP
jgi:PAS domain S-box-containing protein